MPPHRFPMAPARGRCVRIPVALGLLALAPFLSGCPSDASRRPGTTPPPEPRPVDRPIARPTPRPSYWELRTKRIEEAEAKATPGGKAILAAARKMIAADTVIRGACWDYANAVYERAGFGGWRKRATPFKSRQKGPYADPKLVQAGDWLYIINHPETLATHSVIFVHWVDLARREAMVVTYVGGRRDDPGHYREYDVSRIYQITRPKIPTVPPSKTPQPSKPSKTSPTRSAPRR